jgi:dTDP-4-dehydrorhamnose 3,5-epimerase
MRVEQTPLKDCYIIHNSIYKDNRGYFFESFNQQKFAEQTGLHVQFVQDNQSSSLKGVLRGLHFQRGEAAQAKLVRVLQGSVLDIAVDLRRDSLTYGQHYAIELSDTSNTQFFIPRGFAHGFLVLSDMAVFFYKCDNYYSKEAEGGIMYNDPQINIDWGMPESELILSEKDLNNPLLKDVGDIL